MKNPINKKFISLLSLLVILMLTAGGCSDELDFDRPEGPVLTLSTGSNFTRVSDGHYGDDINVELNEEALRRVDLFFFPDDNSLDTEAFYVEEIMMDETAYVDLTVQIPLNLLSKFSDVTATSATGYVYAIVNLPENIVVNEDSRTLGGKKATLQNISDLQVSEPAFVDPGLPQTFVMRGGSEITVTKQDTKWYASGDIRLERLAAKVRLLAQLPDQIYIDLHGNTMEKGENETEEEWNTRKSEAVEIWEPVPDGDNGLMKLYFYNMATAGTINADVADRSILGYENIDRREDYDDIVRNLTETTDETKNYYDEQYSYSHEIPYYSYPNKWDSNLPSEDRKSYVIIMMPWKRTFHKTEQSGEIYQLCYYQVPVNAIKSQSINADCMEPNTYYKIKIRIGTLGNKDYGSPTKISDASYEVLDWVTNPVDVSIKDRRYLVVNQHEWVMNNVETIEIPFSTSHKTIITECTVTYFRYNDVWGTDVAGQPTTAEDIRNFPSHNKNEFDKWLEYADDQLQKDEDPTKGREFEGLIQMKKNNALTTVDGKKGDVLYYKKEYFYDKYYSLKGENGGYRYYVGHEHPITFNPKKIKREDAEANQESDMSGWNLYTALDSVYQYYIDDKKNTINIYHPLIQWEAVRNNQGEITHYKPVKNGHDSNRLWEEFSRCDIVVKIRHEDWDRGDGLFEETIHITQYPGIYITVSHNYSDVNKNEYVFVNGHTSQEGIGTNLNFNYYKIDQLAHFYGSNENPNMYLIHTTQLTPEYSGMFEIGDPRTLNYNNFLASVAGQPADATDGNLADPPGSGLQDAQYIINIGAHGWTSWTWANYTSALSAYSDRLRTAPSADGKGGNRILQYYYPADESYINGVGVKEKFIAPVFRIASSHGRVTINGKIEMRRRCASYQEAGRPAGRWRMPTKAEVKYIAQLSADGKIPILFGNTADPTAFGYYWTAQGGVKANGNGDVENEDYGQPRPYPKGIMATRCVYDEWYWNMIDGGEYAPAITNEALETRFMWGDVEKDNPQRPNGIRKFLKKR